MRKYDLQNGMALVVVIPIFLFLSLISLLFIQMVNSKLSSGTDRLMNVQSNFLARSALQLALLEVQDFTELADPVRKNRRTVEVVLVDSFPQRGTIFFGGHSPGVLFQYVLANESNASPANPGNNNNSPNQHSNGLTLNLDTRVRQNLPAGTNVYLVRDLDGNGQILSVSPRTLENGVIEVNPIQRENLAMRFDIPIILQSKATIGRAQTVIERGIVFP